MNINIRIVSIAIIILILLDIFVNKRLDNFQSPIKRISYYELYPNTKYCSLYKNFSNKRLPPMHYDKVYYKPDTELIDFIQSHLR